MNSVRFIIDYVKKVNLYETFDDDTVEQRQNQVISTRIFLILFIISLTTLVAYASLSLQLTTVRIESPSQVEFENLELDYFNTLVCPCTKTSIQMDSFTQVNITFHKICSSIFVDADWITSLFSSIPQRYYLLDIRRMLSSELQLLSSLCQSSITNMQDTLVTLASNQLFAPTMLSRNDLSFQANVIIDEVQKDAIADFKTTRDFLQSFSQQNGFVSALSSNYIYSYRSDQQQVYSFVKFIADLTYPPTIDYTNYENTQLCSRVDSSSCTYPSGIYPNLTGEASYLYDGAIFPPVLSTVQIPNVYVACMPLDALSASTLECFYDASCLTLLFNTSHIQPLNTNITSIYPITTTFDNLIENLFIENVSRQIYFEAFFRECQPNKCTYSYNARGNVAFIITIILSLIGGLFTGLKVAAPFLLELYYILNKKFKKWFYSKAAKSIAIDSNNDQTNQPILSTKEIIERIRQFLLNYNLFKKPYNDEHSRRNEILSTRVYALLMFISIIVIVFYGLIIQHTLTYQVGSISVNKYRQLYAQYPTLSCDCQNITTEYSLFITFNPRRHQLCSSIFVSNLITPRYYQNQVEFPVGKFDILVAESGFFSAGQSTCDIGGQMLILSLDGFLQTVYVSSYLTSEVEFVSQMNATVNNFINLAPTIFSHTYKLIRYMIQGNQYLTGSFNNAQLQYNSSVSDVDNMIEILWRYPINQSCNCGLSSDSCSMTYDQFCNGTYNGNVTFQTCSSPLPGLVLACYVIEGLLQSSQECLYDINYLLPTINLFLLYFNITDFPIALLIVPLNKNLSSHFGINATGEEIIDSFAVEEWNPNITYDSYYRNCQPTNCYYTVTKNFYIPTIITTIIGLVGGVSVILKIFVPLLIELLRRCRTLNVDNNTISVPWEESRYRRWMKKIQNFNIFVTSETYQSDVVRHDQIISTRLYIFLLIVCVFILTIYFRFSETTTVVTVKNPSINDFQQLQSQDLHGFSCPCLKTSVQFQEFISFNFIPHQICSSDFISQQWLTGVFDYANQFFSVSVPVETQFLEQIKGSIVEFQTKAFSLFRHSVGSIVDISLGNQFMSVFSTNWYFIPGHQGSNAIYTKARSYQSGNCSCGSAYAALCVDPFVIDENNMTIPGMKIGCLPLTGLRLSTLKCFYDQNCVEQVKIALNLQNLSISALNASQTSQFSMNTTLSSIIDNIMLEEWTYETNFSAYYKQCNPQQCTYSLVEHTSALGIFTTLLGLYGGLTIALKVIASIFVKIGRKFVDHIEESHLNHSNENYLIHLLCFAFVILLYENISI